MKAISLPINTLVIIVLALIILIAILALFYGIWPSSVGGVNLEAVKNNACQLLVSTGCEDTWAISIKDFDADKDGTVGDVGVGTGDCGMIGGPANDNLFMLCKCHYFITGADDSEININCRERICHCSP